MTTLDRIVATARELVVADGRLPSMDALAAAAGVSKGGLFHHFRSREALVEAVVRQEIAAVDVALTAAADAGRVVETWLRLSIPTADDVEVYRSLAVAYRAMSAGAPGVLGDLRDANARWEALLSAETGNAIRARMIRLVGDGLLLNALAGTPVDGEALVAALARGPV